VLLLLLLLLFFCLPTFLILLLGRRDSQQVTTRRCSILHVLSIYEETYFSFNRGFFAPYFAGFFLKGALDIPLPIDLQRNVRVSKLYVATVRQELTPNKILKGHHHLTS
jgi:hypothetical protein